MKKLIKAIWIIIFIITIIILNSYKKNILKDEKEIYEINIIDKYNKMQELYEEPSKEEYVLIEISINGIYYRNVGIRTKGSTIYSYLKKEKSNYHSYKIKLDYREEKQNFKGMTEINLNTGNFDTTGIREYLVYYIYNRMGIETQNNNLTSLKIDNENYGIMTCVEVINLNYVYKRYYTKNINLYKPENSSIKNCKGAELRYFGKEKDLYNGIFKNVKTFNTTEDDKERIIRILENINKANCNKNEFEQNFIDFDKIIKMVAINNMVSNIDSFTGKTLRNYYICEIDGKIDIIPFDFNMSMGVNSNPILWNEGDIYNKSIKKAYYNNKDSRILEVITKNDEYIKKYNEYARKTLEIMKSKEMKVKIEQIEAEIDPIMKKNKNSLYTYEEYKKGMEEIKEFINTR